LRSPASPSVLRSIHRPTGWHGESGAAKAGGHVIVDFYLSNNKHLTTHHVYRRENAYRSESSLLHVIAIRLSIFSSVMQDSRSEDLKSDFYIFAHILYAMLVHSLL
jgi:hypothetical protein